MKNIFKKIAVVALVMIMCVSSVVPSISATGSLCPGQGNTHTAVNCSYTVIANVAASCDAAGTVTGQCNSCGVKFVAETVEALGHDWNVAAATCTDPITKTCKTCGKVEVSADITGHVWSKWTVTGGVCKVGERRSRTCSVCNLVESERLAEAHSWVVDTYTEPEYCNEAGVATYVCENGDCTATKTAKLWMAGGKVKHNMVTWDATTMGTDPNAVEATCASVGYYTKVCTVCEYTEVLQVAKKAHTTADLRFIDEVLETAGCNGQGRKAYWECFDCGNRYFAVDDTKTAVYAANGTTYPVYTGDAYASDANYYVVYYDYTYKTDAIGGDYKSANAVRDDVAHDAYTTYVAESCTTDGYYSRHCNKCGLDESAIIPATGHVYYTDVTSTTDQAAFIAAHGLASSTKWANIAPNKADGKGITWTDGSAATCEKNAYVLELCLNVHETKATLTAGASKLACQDDTAMTENTKEYLLSGTGNVALGHQWNTSKGATKVGMPAPTCTTAGVWVYTCGNGCGLTKTESATALGHKWQKVASLATGETTTAATCIADGLQCYTCKNGCGLTKTEVVAKTGEDHVWAYMANFNLNMTAAEVQYKVENLRCGETFTAQRYCSLSTCPASANVVTYTAQGPDHVYYDVENADNLAKIKKLKNIGDTIEVDGVTVVTYLVAGDCTKVASYRLNCTAGCGMFKSFEISEGFNTGAHEVIFAYAPLYTEGYKNVNETCDQTKTHLIGYWYCGVSTCPLYEKAVNKDKTVYEKFTAFSTHLNPETGAAITYKDVPDANVSGAASLAEARNVKAPVDENGNTIYSVAIPGTSLVWLYVAEASCSNDQVVVGGLYCPDCANKKLVLTDNANQAAALIGTKREAYHAANVKTTVVPATCTSYGYTEEACTECFYTVQKNYEAIKDHDFDYANATVVSAACDRDGYVIVKCKGCDLLQTTITPAYGHKNAAGETITTSCLDNYAIDRKCAACTKIFVPAHEYANGKCVRCGAAE